MRDAPQRWSVLVLLCPPLVALALVVAGLVSGPAAGDEDGVRSGTGWYDARAHLVPAPPASEMKVAGMHAAMGHSDEIQVVLQVRNDTDAPITVPFDRITLDGEAATAGLLGDLVVRPNAAVEERLRFPAPAGADRVRLVVPDGDGERVLDLAVRTPGEPARTTPSTPARSPLGTGHGHGHR